MQKQRQYMPLLNPIYPPGFQQAFLEVKTKIEKGQYTKETNQLIEKIIPFNPSNYSVWVAKKRIYEAGQTTIQHQDQYSRQVLKDNVKNFQLWDFRNFIVSITKNYEDQLNLMDEILQQSHKNYHCWSNRVLIVNQTKEYEQQIQRTEKYIQKDIHNNSIWSYRFFCFERSQTKNYKNQILFVMGQIIKDIENQAAWNYLRGFFPSYKINIPSKPKNVLSFQDYPQVATLCKQIIEEQKFPENKKIQAILTLSIINSQSEETLKYAREACQLLATLQPLRAHYYNWLRNN